jgi:hypothetical protein
MELFSFERCETVGKQKSIVGLEVSLAERELLLLLVRVQ